MGWLSTLVGAGSALVAGGLTIAADKNNKEQALDLSNAKLKLQTGINAALVDPANKDKKAQDIIDEQLKSIDQSKFSSHSLSDLNEFATAATAKVQQKLDIASSRNREQAAADNAVNLMNQLDNHITAGTIDVAGAENLYNDSVKGVLHDNLSQAAYDKYDTQFKSHARLLSLKNMSSDEAHKALKSDDYIKHMTASDYQTATEYVKSIHAENVKHQADIFNTQYKIAKDVLNGNFTPNEINIIKAQNQDINSSALMHTVHTFEIIKKMTVPELEQILKPPSTQRDKQGNMLPIDQMRSQVTQDDNFKSLITNRISSIQSESQKNLVEFAAHNDELAPLDMTSSVGVKTSMAHRVVQVANLQHKYRTKAKSLFTAEETQNLNNQFQQSNNKAQILSSTAKVLPQSQYSEGDHIFYKGAGADMYSIQHGAINFANDSYRGYEIQKAKATFSIPAKTTTAISAEIQRFTPVTDVKHIASMTNQITNVMIARGINPNDVQASDVDKLIQESTNSIMYPQKSTLGIFAKDAYILAPDKQRASILGAIGKYKGFWARDHEPKLFAKITGGVDLLDLHTSSGAKVDLKHLARHTILKNLTPNTYQMVYTDYTGQTSTLYDKDKKPVIIDATKINQDDIDNFNKLYGDVGGSGVAELRDNSAPKFTNIDQINESIAQGGNA